MAASSYEATIQLADECFEAGKVENHSTFDGANTIDTMYGTHNSVRQWMTLPHSKSMKKDADDECNVFV